MKMLLNVTLERLENKINRQVLVSQDIPLTDLCEYIIVAMNGKKIPLYRLEINDILYYPEEEVDEENDEKTLFGLTLKDLSLKKDDVFQITYDYDQYYFFDVCVDAFLEDDHDVGFQVLSGKGYGLMDHKGGVTYLNYLLNPPKKWDDSCYKKHEKEYLQKKFDVVEVNNRVEEYRHIKEEQKLPKHYIFNVSLKGFAKEIKRKICVNSDILIEDFCRLVVVSMNGDLSHMFGIRVDKEFLNEYYFDLELFYLNLKEKQKLDIIYDFGDNWVFNLTLSKIEDGYIDTPFQVLSGKGYGIIDDCGGSWSLAQIFDGKDRSWGRHNINDFDLEKCNRKVMRIMK